ncbi:MAG: cobalamin biosynthesis protein CobD [Planctomycetes bacterium]|nr:cobalamin biosynthesis protein CobD [Planctomycetota bacterium]
MRLEYQILAAVALDLLIGDPRRLPHPVRGIGLLALGLECPARRCIPWPKVAGVCVAVVTVGLTGAAAFAVIAGAGYLHPFVADAASILLIYTAVATRDMARHSMQVYRALSNGDLAEARKRVGMIVGRDTDRLDEPGVVRATVESVAESIVDGITAPLFFAALFGPVGALAYRAINTLDSTFGYKNDRYVKFGWASARLDDLANLIPARLTAPLVCLAAAGLRERAAVSLRTMLRDARRHASPNSGFTEAAVAGALGVQLGGLNYYLGRASRKPAIGDRLEALEKAHIPRVNALMFVTVGIFLALCLGARALVVFMLGGVQL